MMLKGWLMYKIVEYRKVEGKKNLKGYLDIYDEEKKWMISGCSLFSNGGNFWVNMPSRSYKNETGETKYSNIIQMQKEDQDVFSKEVLEALKHYDKNAPKAFSFKKETSKVDEFELPF